MKSKVLYKKKSNYINFKPKFSHFEKKSHDFLPCKYYNMTKNDFEIVVEHPYR